MKNDHIHLRGEIKTVQWTDEGLPESLILDTNTRVDLPLASLIDPDAIIAGAIVEVDGETNFQSNLASVHHAQVRVDGKLVADSSHVQPKVRRAKGDAQSVRMIAHVQSIAFQLGGAIDHLVLDSGLIVHVDPSCQISDDLSIGDSIEVVASPVAESKTTFLACSIEFLKNAH